MNNLGKEFLLGAATAAHQVEGNNIHSDFWAMEHMVHSTFVEPSLDAVDHYNRYKEDVLLMKNSGLNAYRFSIEWARIEPEEGKFDDNEINHYLDVIHFCKKNSIEPIVTMHHFSSPKWLLEKGGWEAESTVDYFARYCEYTIKKIGAELKYVCTINEANMGLQIAAISKRYMKQMMEMPRNTKEASTNTEGSVQLGLDMQKMMSNRENAAKENIEIFGVSDPKTFTSARSKESDLLTIYAHEKARDAMKAAFPHLQIGLTLSLHDIQYVVGGEEHALNEWKEEFSHYLPYIKNDDFLGVQNYTRSIFDKDGIMAVPDGAEVTQMNYEFYPEALEHVIRKVHEEFKGPLIITENGIATDDDTRRVEFIYRATNGVKNCINDGIPVKGYLYWSLLDNFEWQKGFGMTFGLIAVDRKTQKRMPKPSLEFLGSIR